MISVSAPLLPLSMLARPLSLPLKQWWKVTVGSFLAAAGALVFAFLDLVDVILCVFYRVADAVLEETPMPCYCHRLDEISAEGGRNGTKRALGRGEREEASETLYGRVNLFREMGLLRSHRRREGGKKRMWTRTPRWSDCCCDACVSSVGEENGKQLLHFVVKKPSSQAIGGCCRSTTDVIFLHGFLSSSSFWTETVFSNLSEAAVQSCRLFAVDLLGFGRSPKPADSLYTVEEHVGMIERTVIEPFGLDSFHLVAHSMGCVIALAIAAKYSQSVKSITLIAPPYFCSTKDEASHNALNRLAARRLWPPSLFGSSVMSWYEHLGRSICFIVCRNHRKWEWILKLITRRDPHFLIVDITKHTHHSAWHTMHNVICGGAKSAEEHLEALNRAGIPAKVIHGSKDQIVLLECSYSMKSRSPFLNLQVIPGADHISVVLGRERELTTSLEQLWLPSPTT